MNAIADMLRKARSAVLRRGVGADDADDMVQEAFLRLESYERAQAVRSQEAFLVTAAVNLSIDHARRAARSPIGTTMEDFEHIASDAAGPDEVLASRQRLDRLREAMAHLPERTRRILLARRIDNESFKQIAAREGLTVSAVEKQVARATLSLMQWVDGQ